MSIGVINIHARCWRMATARFLLSWVILQSVFAVAMPIASAHESCSRDIAHSVHEHSFSHTLHEGASFELSSDFNIATDNTDCEQHCCVLGCQLLGAHPIAAVHVVEPFQHVQHPPFPLITKPLDLLFRPPIA